MMNAPVIDPAVGMADPAAALHPLFARLVREFGACVVTPDRCAAWAAEGGDRVLLLGGDPVRFPALRLAGECLNAGGAACTILNGANEMAVAAFLRDEIPFGAISRIVEGTLEACGAMPADTLEDIFHADFEARRRAKEIAEKLK